MGLDGCRVGGAVGGGRAIKRLCPIDSWVQTQGGRGGSFQFRTAPAPPGVSRAAQTGGGSNFSPSLGGIFDFPVSF